MKKILILAVKGGTGKSTVTAGLAQALKTMGLRVGLMDLDLSGANLPMAIGMLEPLPHAPIDIEKEKMLAVQYDGFEIFSLAFRFGSAALLWGGSEQTIKAFGKEFHLRGTGRYQLVKQMLENVQFGDLDYLLVDNPPSTGDEVLSLYENMPDIYGCILVSQPTNLAVEDMERALDMVESKELPLIGMVGNMVSALCPSCGHEYYPFAVPGVDLELFCRRRMVPYLLSIPMTPETGVLQERFAQLAEIVINQQPVHIWEKAFKDRLENAIVKGAMKAVIKGIGERS